MTNKHGEPLIQYLRAIAAVLVVIDHCSSQVVGWRGVPGGLTQLGHFLGEQGVAIFFVISGHIMAKTTFRMSGAIDASEFFIRRLIRIVPLYWCFTLFAFLLIASGFWLRGREVNIYQLILSLLFLPYGSEPMRPILGQGWTLQYEVFFYTIFVLFIIAKAKLGSFASVYGVPVVLGMLVLAGWAAADLLPQQLSFFLRDYLLLFAAGVLLSSLRPGVQVWSQKESLFAIAFLAAGSLLVYLIFLPAYDLPIWRVFFWSIDTLIVCIAMRCRDVPVGRLSKFALALGDASFSIYLSHVFLVYLFARIWRTAFDQSYAYAYIALCTVLSSIIGLVIYAMAESPVQTGLTSRFKSFWSKNYRSMASST